MTKPDDIPRDIREAAVAAYFGAWKDHDEHFNPASNSISDGLSLRFIEASARAIMAEREACAQVAARAYFSGRPFPVTTGEVAAAIRNRGADAPIVRAMGAS